MIKASDYAWPEWALWMQAIGPTSVSVVTAVVAIAVGVIAYRQWTTAQRKLVLDLFDRPYSIYERVKSGVDLVIRDAGVENDAIQKVASVRYEARFVFGAEVEQYIGQL